MGRTRRRDLRDSLSVIRSCGRGKLEMETLFALQARWRSASKQKVNLVGMKIVIFMIKFPREHNEAMSDTECTLLHQLHFQENSARYF